MVSGIGSVFDLTVAEKLQLVEDLWDDLAATPETVPIYDWQKEELPAEGPVLLATRVPGCRGKRSSEEFAAAMAVNPIIAREAEQDVAEAYATMQFPL